MAEITILTKVNVESLFQKGQVFNTHNEANIVLGMILRLRLRR